MQETWIRFLGQEDTLEKETATHSSILAWRIPWTEEPGGNPMDRGHCSLVGYSPWGCKESGTTERLSTAHVKFHPGFMILELVFEQNNSIGFG